MQMLKRWWRTIRGWFGGQPASPAAALMEEMRSQKGPADPAWVRARNRLATQVFSEADRQRLWVRAHRGASQSARLLSGIRHPTPEERRLLEELVEELERGR